MTQRTTDEALAWYETHTGTATLGFNPDGMCLKICRTARNLPGVYASAVEAQRATPAKHRITDLTGVRPGMVMYFDDPRDGNPFGHIVTVASVKAGGAKTLSDIAVWTNSVSKGRVVKVTADHFPQHWGDGFVFASDWLNDSVLDLPKTKPAEPTVKKPAAKKANEIVFKVGHSSLQFSDTAAQKTSDIGEIFAQDYHWITGTEALEADARKALAAAAKKHGYALWVPAGQDSWVAISKAIIKPGSKPIEYYSGHIVPGKAKVNAAKGVVALGFVPAEPPVAPLVTVVATHYMAKGRPNAKAPAYKANVSENRALAKGIGEYVVEVGKGEALVFYGGDQNILDNVDDTFFKQPLTSCWDELGKHPKTHAAGNIDVIASYDRDGRVRCLGARRFTDKQKHLHTDHLLIQARYAVRRLEVK